MNRFPFPPEGEPPLGPIELLTYIVGMETPAMQDDLSQGIKWTKAIQDFVRLWYVLSTTFLMSWSLIQYNFARAVSKRIRRGGRRPASCCSTTGSRSPKIGRPI